VGLKQIIEAVEMIVQICWQRW